MNTVKNHVGKPLEQSQETTFQSGTRVRKLEWPSEETYEGVIASNLEAMASTLVAMASNLLAMASNLIGMASNLIAKCWKAPLLKAYASAASQENWRGNISTWGH